MTSRLFGWRLRQFVKHNCVKQTRIDDLITDMILISTASWLINAHKSLAHTNLLRCAAKRGKD